MEEIQRLASLTHSVLLLLSFTCRRLELCSALLMNPDILILDEPLRYAYIAYDISHELSMHLKLASLTHVVLFFELVD